MTFTFRQPRFVRNTFAFTGMVFWRIRDGKVVERGRRLTVWVCSNNLPRNNGPANQTGDNYCRIKRQLSTKLRAPAGSSSSYTCRRILHSMSNARRTARVEDMLDEPDGGHATRSSAQSGRRRCVTRVENEVVARAEAVIDEVEGPIVTYSIIHDDVVLRHTSVESREYGDVGCGNDNDTPGERDAMDIARGTARFVLAHPVLPKHDVIAAGDQDTHAG